MAYVVTRPLGASIADCISKPSSTTGLGFGNGPTAVVFAVATFLLVSYLAIAQPDIQRSFGPAVADRRPVSPTREYLTGTPGLEVE